MGLRFRWRIKIAPGLRLNLSRRGGSVSVGVPGATLGLGRAKRLTIGIPGTGVSYSRSLGGASGKQSSHSAAWWLAAVAIAVVAGLYLLGRLAG